MVLGSWSWREYKITKVLLGSTLPALGLNG